MTNDSSDRRLQLVLSSAVDDLLAMRDRDRQGEAFQLEQLLVRQLPEAMLAVDDDLNEVSIYCLGHLSPDMRIAAFEEVGFVYEYQEARLADIAARAGLMASAAQSSSGILRGLPAKSTPNKWTPIPYTGAKVSELVTIIHGTWAHKTAIQSEWWEPGGSFHAPLETYLAGLQKPLTLWNDKSDYFFWTGNDRDADRKQAADDFTDWAQDRLAPTGSLIVLCHSHGGNVALLAAKGGLVIDRLIIMGTPIRTDYTLAMKNVRELVNIYSPTDVVQTLGAAGRRRGEGRTLADSTVITNLCTADPLSGHSDTHDWATWQDADNVFNEKVWGT